MPQRPPSKPRAIRAESPAPPQKQDRLAAALRANLRRRKAQQRQQAEEAEHGGDPLSDLTGKP